MKMKNRRLVSVLAFALTTSAGASSAQADEYTGVAWSCSNPDMEVSCPAGKCEVAETHTPMSVTASASGLEVCAYSGCWAGEPAAALSAGRFQIYTGIRLLYMLDTDDGAHASLTIDTKSGIGTLLITGMYAQPMVCDRP